MNGLFDAVLELGLGQPDELVVDLRRVDGIAHIMALPVRDKGDEALGLFQLAADEADNIDVLHLVVAADVVHFPHPSFVDDEVDRFAVIFHIQPIADILPRAVDGERLIC